MQFESEAVLLFGGRDEFTGAYFNDIWLYHPRATDPAVVKEHGSTLSATCGSSLHTKWELLSPHPVKSGVGSSNSSVLAPVPRDHHAVRGLDAGYTTPLVYLWGYYILCRAVGPSRGGGARCV
jgi:hypothetical protein